MVYFLFFIFELLILFFFSRRISQSISGLLFALTKNHNATIHILSFLFLPGVIVHELAHMLVASILFVPVGQIEFMPQIHAGGVKMGSVEIGKTDPIRRALIGIAPVLVGLGILLGSLFYLYSDVTSFSSITESFSVWKFLLGIYIFFQVANTMFSSKKDIEGTLELLIVFGIIGVLLYLVGIPVGEYIVTFLSSTKVEAFFYKAALFLGIPLIIDVVVLLLFKATGR